MRLPRHFHQFLHIQLSQKPQTRGLSVPVSTYGTNLADTHFIPKSLVKMAWHDVSLIPTSSAISWIVKSCHFALNHTLQLPINFYWLEGAQDTCHIWHFHLTESLRNLCLAQCWICKCYWHQLVSFGSCFSNLLTKFKAHALFCTLRHYISVTKMLEQLKQRNVLYTRADM
jgi:hypothetical protein